MNFVLTLAIRNATESNVKIFSKYTIFWLLVSILPCIIFYKIGYNLAFTLLSLIFLTISLNKIFNYEICDISVTSSITFCSDYGGSTLYVEIKKVKSRYLLCVD